MKKLQEVGKVIKSHKLNGAVKIKLLNFEFLGNDYPSFLYINTEEKPLPYFISSFDKIGKKECIIQFEEWDNKEAVNTQLKGKLIFIDPNEPVHRGFQALKEQGKTNYTGYQLFDQNQLYIGTIEDVYEIPNNTLLSLDINNREVLIPFHNNLLIEVKNNQQEIHLQIPEGLINLAVDSSEEE